jgi:surface polysaccharide O-acyltransferase-like enzyme
LNGGKDVPAAEPEAMSAAGSETIPAAKSEEAPAAAESETAPAAAAESETTPAAESEAAQAAAAQPVANAMKHYLPSFGYLRITACLAIVLLHNLFAAGVYYKDTITQHETLYSAIGEHLLMWAVPCFLMVTGALLLDPAREVSFRKLTGKYLRRMVEALILFTFVFQICDYIVGENKTILRGGLKDLVFGQSWAHLWYLYLMIGLYLMMPFYKVITRYLSDEMVQFLIVLYLIFTAAIPTLQSFGLPVAFYIPTTIVYPVYLFLGYEIHRHGMGKFLSWFLFLGCGAVLVVLSFLRYSGVAYTEGLDDLFGYSSLLVVGQSCGMFGIFDGIRTKKCPAVIRNLDHCTFGIYLIHMIFIHWVMKWQGIDPFQYGAWFFAAVSVAFFLISWAITAVLRKIPKFDIL